MIPRAPLRRLQSLGRSDHEPHAPGPRRFPGRKPHPRPSANPHPRPSAHPKPPGRTRFASAHNQKALRSRLYSPGAHQTSEIETSESRQNSKRSQVATNSGESTQPLWCPIRQRQRPRQDLSEIVRLPRTTPQRPSAPRTLLPHLRQLRTSPLRPSSRSQWATSKRVGSRERDDCLPCAMREPPGRRLSVFPLVQRRHVGLDHRGARSRSKGELSLGGLRRTRDRSLVPSNVLG